jgi:hypothetical protein
MDTSLDVEDEPVSQNDVPVAPATVDVEDE